LIVPTLSSGFGKQSAPKNICEEISPLGKKFVKMMEEALEKNDGVRLFELVFDADCEGLEDQLDLKWYELKA
jgi:hypothetical protein